jgi:hypothetical protein
MIPVADGRVICLLSAPALSSFFGACFGKPSTSAGQRSCVVQIAGRTPAIPTDGFPQSPQAYAGIVP